MKPILFSTDMVRAILAGEKTQTRRVIKPQPPEYVEEIIGPVVYDRAKVDINVRSSVFGDFVYGAYDKWGEWTAKCPYEPGDTLWVRETWCEAGVYGYAYKATEDLPTGVQTGWRSPIHMPHAAARLFLRVKNVRVERVQDITEEDAKAEGVPALNGFLLDHSEEWCKYSVIAANTQGRARPTAADWIGGFAYLWDRLNAKRGYPWQANPFCWVISFEVCGKEG